MDDRRARVVAGLVIVVLAGVVSLTLSGAFSSDEEEDPVAATSATRTGAATKPRRPSNDDCYVVFADGRCLRGDERSSREAGRVRDLKDPPRPGRAPRLSLTRAVGAKIMTGMRGAFPSEELLGRIRRGEVGGVIIMGYNVSSRLSSATAAMRRAAREGGGVGLVIATDQEGGEVRRLSDIPPTASPAQMGSQGAEAALQQGSDTGRALRRRGVNVDLAPVADVLQPGGFMAQRAFGTSPAVVAAGACGFAEGLAQARVGATLKHFPGLGRATTNTDNARAIIGASAEALERDLTPYRECVRQVPLVMVSNAVYSGLDRSGPAVLSRRVVTGLLREKLGFGGVTISDTLAAPSVASATTALKASRAGVDMLLYIDDAVAATAYQNVLAAAESGELSQAPIRKSAQRIRALQRELG